MPREATGSIKPMQRTDGAFDHFAVAVFVPPDRRHMTEGRNRLWYHLKPDVIDEGRAKKIAADLTERVRGPDLVRARMVIAQVRRGRGHGSLPIDVAPSQGEQANEWFQRYLELHEKLGNGVRGMGAWNRWVGPPRPGRMRALRRRGAGGNPSPRRSDKRATTTVAIGGELRQARLLNRQASWCPRSEDAIILGWQPR